MGPLERFSPVARGWFRAAFEEPTRAQALGWASIASGEHTLLHAPTGSGKTLAAFLWCLDRLATSATPEAQRRCRVLYCSPLKALNYDVERNLTAPLVGMRLEAERLGLAMPEIRVATRTGDTPAEQRRDLLRHPPDVLITTPESLYLMLTSQARETLRSVEWLIVDEIHAVAGTKRGAHLALSLERLERLAARAPQRIGLSATQRPLEELARFLGGTGRQVNVVDAGERKPLDLEVVVPVDDMQQPPPLPIEQIQAGLPPGVATERWSIWPAIYTRVLELIRQHRSTLVFVNSRRLAERLAARLNELAGEELVLAHHGSIARERRMLIEEALKAGRVRGLVATSSLELGIDMGAVDLVVQVESPTSVASGLQRIGRAGHHVHAVSAGKLFPKYRGDLLKAAVVVERMHAGAIEATRVPRNPLDVLAQQIVAMCAVDTWQVDELEATVRRAYNFADLGHTVFESVLDLLAGRYPSHEFAGLKPRLVWDRLAGTVTARSDARTVAVTSGGTIPDRGLYGVFLGEGGPRVGELDEEMVYEARPGETFLLGASTWRIERITFQQVIVFPAPGEPGKMPFWKGDGVGRPVELGRALGAFTREIAALPEDEAVERLRARHNLDQRAARNLLAYLAEEREATGALPTDQTIVVERFRDELGDWRVCILSPFGGRVHAPWALALEARLRPRMGGELQAIWSDDGIALRLPEAEEEDLAGLVTLEPEEVEDLVVQALGHSALFAGRFRENAARALLLPRRYARSRTPLWQQRQRAADLLKVASRYESFPILLETYRECLRDIFDVPALVDLLRQVRSRAVRLVAVDVPRASPFASSLLFSYIAEFMYEGDAPLAERRAQALALNRELLRELLGQEELRELLDARAIEELELELQCLAPNRRARSLDATYDLLRRLGDLSTDEVCARVEAPRRTAEGWVDELARARRIVGVRLAGEARWIAVEDVGRYRDAAGVPSPPGVPDVFLQSVEDALEGLLARYARTHAPFLAREAAERFGLPTGPTTTALERLAARGSLLLGEFRPAGSQREWCAPEVLQALRRRSLAHLRREVEPVPTEAYARFLPQWQGVGSHAAGLDRLAEVVAQLEGVALPASVLERDVLSARVRGYQPRLLDELCSAGEVMWVGRGALQRDEGRIGLYRRDRIATLRPAPVDPPDGDLHERIRQHLAERGASFYREIHAAVGGGPDSLVLAALWDLAWAGEVTNDTFAPLRALRHRRTSSGRAGPPRLSRLGPPEAAGRWSLVAQLLGSSGQDTARAHALALQLLERYGVVTREAVLAEGVPGGFAWIYPVLKAMEEAGRARRGYFVEGLGAAQFALPGAVDRLRALREVEPLPVGDGCRVTPDGYQGDDSIPPPSPRHPSSVTRHATPATRHPDGRAIILAATDPANPYGAGLPWPERRDGVHGSPQRAAGAYVALVDGRVALYLKRDGRSLVTLAPFDDSAVAEAAAAALAAWSLARDRRALNIDHVDGVRALDSPHRPLLARAGFERDYLGLTLRAG